VLDHMYPEHFIEDLGNGRHSEPRVCNARSRLGAGAAGCWT
jgi:hypothetical protein